MAAPDLDPSSDERRRSLSGLKGRSLRLRRRGSTYLGDYVEPRKCSCARLKSCSVLDKTGMSGRRASVARSVTLRRSRRRARPYWQDVRARDLLDHRRASNDTRVASQRSNLQKAFLPAIAEARVEVGGNQSAMIIATPLILLREIEKHLGRALAGHVEDLWWVRQGLNL